MVPRLSRRSHAVSSAFRESLIGFKARQVQRSEDVPEGCNGQEDAVCAAVWIL